MLYCCNIQGVHTEKIEKIAKDCEYSFVFTFEIAKDCEYSFVFTFEIGSHYVAQAGLELTFLLTQPPN
jgi:hypothetical protein